MVAPRLRLDRGPSSSDEVGWPAARARDAMAEPLPRRSPTTDAAPGLAWSGGLFGPEEVERLVDRLTVALHGQTTLVRELAEAQEALEREKREADEARHRAERARETLETFLRALGHDLRAPFVAVDATLQLLELESGGIADDAFRARALDDAAELRRTAAHGLALLDDLFELIRSDAGQWRVEPQACTVDELLRDLRSVVHAQAQARSVSLAVVSHAAPLELATDPVRLRQALANLVLNAVQHAGQGTVVLEIESVDDDRVRFRVLDEGPGLPADVSGLFEPFARGARTDGTPRPKGLGLGLAIARRCATLLGGTLVASNRPARGAVFTLEIPRAIGRPADSAPPADPVSEDPAPLGPAHAVSPSSAPRRVLVVDDAADARRLLAHHVRALGHHAAAAASLAEARALLDARAFDLVVADRRLGDGDGTSLAAHPAVADGTTRLAVSSADPDGVGIEAGAGASPRRALPALPKPVDRRSVERLLAAIAPAGRR